MVSQTAILISVHGDARRCTAICGRDLIDAVHIPSQRRLSEMLGVPCFVRFELVEKGDNEGPSLLVKDSTLHLKYLLRLREFALTFVTLADDGLAYCFQVKDDPENPFTLWSVVEEDRELAAMKLLVNDPTCSVHLFNELAVNVASAETQIDFSGDFERMLNSCIPREMRREDDAAAVSIGIDRIWQRIPIEASRGFRRSFVDEWHEIDANFTASEGISKLLLSDKNEGAQQEELAVWLTDQLHPPGSSKRPQVHVSGRTRELCDVLINSECGAFYIESKALAILDDSELPSRNELTKRVAKRIKKGCRQLSGALRSVRSGCPVSDEQGNVIDVDQTHTPHCIVLVPELSLLAGSQEFGRDFLSNWIRTSEAFLHILDPVELLRIVQAAEMISERNRIPKIQAFDYYLTEREERALQCPTPYFQILLRLES